MALHNLKFLTQRRIEAGIFLFIFLGIFGCLSLQMGLANMLNTIMNTAYSLLINTVFYIMAITVISGALSNLLIEFGVMRLIEIGFRPMMKPFFNLPGVAALGGVLTFLSDNPAVINLAKDSNFNKYFKKYQLISLVNFGTSLGMGLIVLVFMIGLGYGTAAAIGLVGVFVGAVVSTRLLQYFVLKTAPELRNEEVGSGDEQKISFKSEGGIFLRVLNTVLDGGKSGVEIGVAVIPGVLVISTFIMIFTFGASESGEYTGAAYEGIALLPYLAGKINIVFEWLFGFTHPELIAFPITSLGAVGGALGLVPRFSEMHLLDNNAIAVFTAMGTCWGGFMSTHTGMFDSLGFRKFTSKGILAHTIAGIVAGITAHWAYVLFSLFVS